MTPAAVRATGPIAADLDRRAGQDVARPRPAWQRMRPARLPGGRLHLHHGPIDLVIGATGAAEEVAAAFRQAARRFEGLLEEVVRDLQLLRQPLGEIPPPGLQSPISRRMVAVCHPQRALWVTPMAAVAGAVAEAVLAAMLEGRRLSRAYVNNGGDIAFHLSGEASFRLGLVASLSHALPESLARIPAASRVRGAATSGFGGRSLSRGIAEAVTVLARGAAEADVAATLIANAVDLDHPAIRRLPARCLQEDSDLGELPVTVAVGPLPAPAVTQALRHGTAAALEMLESGAIEAAQLVLRSQTVKLHRREERVSISWT